MRTMGRQNRIPAPALPGSVRLCLPGRPAPGANRRFCANAFGKALIAQGYRHDMSGDDRWPERIKAA